MFKKIKSYILLILCLALIYAMRIVRYTIGTVRVLLFIVGTVVKLVGVIVVFVIAFPVSLVARLLGFLAFIIIDGCTRGYVVTKDEISVGARVARRLKVDVEEDSDV